ncbi:MAG TPA: GNAT family N-acetyltransferase, partial [Chthoniobacterales bacterium]|nr:GNAT family N-acetyltransferase [Chthoniobacterales bacterium]
MNFEIIPAAALSLSEQARVVNAAFAGYVAGWGDLDAEGLAQFLCLQGADLSHSRFLRTADGSAGFGYINRIARIPRLATMGLEPAARGTGAAAYLLNHLLGEATERGDGAMVLEVIEQNPRALTCYRRQGFRELTRLTGWRRTGGFVPTGRDLAVEEIPICDALKLASGRDYPELPWAITR